MKNALATFVITTALVASPLLIAQEPPPPGDAAKSAAPSGKSGITPLRVLVTVSRYQGEKKVSSLPYSLSVSVGGPPVRFRMGADLPYSSTPTNDGAKTQSYSYRTVGIGIDIAGQLMIEPGLFKLDISVSDSSVASSNQILGAPAVTGVPMFRNFSTNGSVMLRDGQTTQLSTSADPVTGETMRVDVALTVLK